MKRFKFSLLFAALAMLVTPALSTGAAQAAGSGGVGINIVGGSNATQQYGAISLWSLNPYRHRCTASLIDPYWALTAAHCGTVIAPGVAEIHASSLDNTINFEDPGILAMYIHPQYDRNLLKNDLALIRFKRPIQRTTPLQLTRATVGVGTLAKVAGWGWVCEDLSNPNCGHSVNILQELGVKVAKPSQCPAMWDPDNELCIISANEAHAMACFGDSGGPLVKPNVQGGLDLVGITSYDGDDWDTNSGCATNPEGTAGTGVFVRVSEYIDWINQTIHPVGPQLSAHGKH